MELATIFPVRLRSRLTGFLKRQDLEEVRVRIGQAIEMICAKESFFLDSDGHGGCVTAEDIGEMLNYISHYSLYAYRDKIRQGFVTVEGGHRIGLCGSAVMEHGEIAGISPVSFLNIRIAHEKCGCAGGLLPWVCHDDGIYHTLLISKPGIGKTTYLRDLIRLLSQNHLKVSVVDERCELAACHRGVPQNDLGPATDVLEGCTKAEGMMLLLRVMSPDVIAVDELGKKEDFAAVEEACFCGCKILATLHADDLTQVQKKPYLEKWVKQNLFERYILLLRGVGGERSYQVFDGNLERLC